MTSKAAWTGQICQGGISYCNEGPPSSRPTPGQFDSSDRRTDLWLSSTTSLTKSSMNRNGTAARLCSNKSHAHRQQALISHVRINNSPELLKLLPLRPLVKAMNILALMKKLARKQVRNCSLTLEISWENRRTPVKKPSLLYLQCKNILLYLHFNSLN